MRNGLIGVTPSLILWVSLTLLAQAEKRVHPTPGNIASEANQQFAQSGSVGGRAGLRKWRHLAEQGNAEAQIMLGWAYHDGVTVRQDYKQAAHWFRRSAEQGNPDAQVNLGMMYDEGVGVKQSYETAFKWYRMAAEQGSENAQLILGDMYSEGLGVPRDYVQAHMWYSIVGIRGLPRGDEHRAKVEKNMTRAQITKAEKLARAWMLAHQR